VNAAEVMNGEIREIAFPVLDFGARHQFEKYVLGLLTGEDFVDGHDFTVRERDLAGGTAK
jgi:hypothetical protein